MMMTMTNLIIKRRKNIAKVTLWKVEDRVHHKKSENNLIHDVILKRRPSHELEKQSSKSRDTSPESRKKTTKSPHLSPKEKKELQLTKEEFDGKAKLIESLLMPKSDDEKKLSRNNSSDKDKEEKKSDGERKSSKPKLADSVSLQQEYERQLSKIDKDPSFEEVVDDSNLSEKLRRQREEKTKERLKKAQKQSDKTKTFEKAIEDIGNANEDERRLINLQETLKKLHYESKPNLDGTKIVSNNRSRQPTVDKNNASMRSRSFSGTRRNNKYNNVKPKIVTRVPLSSRNGNESMDESFGDNNQQNLNDSNSIRQKIYNEWYEKKMYQTKETIKSAREKVKDEEEKKSEEAISKLKKSVYILKIWNEKKLLEIKAKNKDKVKKEDEINKKKKEEDSEKDNVKKAFDQWKKDKEENLKEKVDQKKSESDKKKEIEKKMKKKRKDAESAFDIWKSKKEKDLEEKLSKVKEDEKKKKDLRDEFEKKKNSNKRAYEEWLDKKEEEMIKNAERSINSTSMSALPPFYPSSRTIAFGR